MKLALVASSYLPRPGALERHVHELAAGLTLGGAEVEVLTQDLRGRLPSVSEFEGFVVRRFAVPFVGSGVAIVPHFGPPAPHRRIVRCRTRARRSCLLAFAAARADPPATVFTLTPGPAAAPPTLCADVPRPDQRRRADPLHCHGREPGNHADVPVGREPDRVVPNGWM